MQLQYTTPRAPHTSQSARRVTSCHRIPRSWLEQWHTARRSLSSNLFHVAVRDGAATPAMVVGAVQAAIRRRLHSAPPFDATDEFLHAVWRARQTASHEECPSVEAVITWEHLPHAERERQKVVRAQHYWHEDVASLPLAGLLLRYLNALEHPGETTTNRAEASVLIDSI